MAAWILLAAAGWPSLVLAIELLAAQFPHRRIASGGAPSIVIVIPARDEADRIADTIGHARTAAPAGTRVLVVADNCADDTAEKAQAAGADTIERNDPQHFGKGFALGLARWHLAANPPDIVMILDADCMIEEGGVARLAAVAQSSGRPVQSAYLMRPRPDRGLLVALSGFAFLLRNLVRQRGLARLGAPALLTGSGMAFPWLAFAAAKLDDDDLVEDLSIGIALCQAKIMPAFCASVTTWSDPAGRGSTLRQRARWEHGFLRTAIRKTPSLIATRRWPLVWLGLHLTVPPLALLGLVDIAALVLLRGSPFGILAALLILLALLMLLSWARFGRGQIRAWQFLLIPLYMIWKLPLYAAALLRPERRWNRTSRD